MKRWSWVVVGEVAAGIIAAGIVLAVASRVLR
jgi:hypothetical protein